nr:hypothetical protein [uncultured bacterium]AMP54301.1 hypothetical protein [uncultured bacterium]AMP54377.1 hypothetical protein [uncultured bacterium]AMP54416.1 hypothetical protein [uncultured bacterium]AMP54465.1 hypothetical protein [uncultured bacterium]
MKQFNTESNLEPITFKIDDVEYSTRSNIPAGTFLEIMAKARKAQGAESNNNDPVLAINMMKTILSPDSWKEMRKRLYDDHEEDVIFIDMKTIVDVVQWLGEEIGKRPTQKQ